MSAQRSKNATTTRVVVTVIAIALVGAVFVIGAYLIYFGFEPSHDAMDWALAGDYIAGTYGVGLLLLTLLLVAYSIMQGSKILETTQMAFRIQSTEAVTETMLSIKERALDRITDADQNYTATVTGRAAAKPIVDRFVRGISKNKHQFNGGRETSGELWRNSLKHYIKNSDSKSEIGYLVEIVLGAKAYYGNLEDEVGDHMESLYISSISPGERTLIQFFAAAMRPLEEARDLRKWLGHGLPRRPVDYTERLDYLLAA